MTEQTQDMTVYDDGLLFVCDEAACHEDPMFYEIFTMDNRWDIIRTILKAADARASRMEIIDECARQVPTTWLDPLLSGPKIVGGFPARDTEALLRGIQDRIRALKSSPQESGQ